MKLRVLTFFSAALLLFSACSEQNRSGDLSLIDEQAVFPMDQTSWENYLTTEQAIYHREDKLLTFCPKGDTHFYPLCGKPNCDHTTPDCNAWLENGNGLGCHGGRLYAVVGSEEIGSVGKLISMKPNGEDRRTELELQGLRTSSGSVRDPSYFRFHQNRLLCFFDPDFTEPYEQQLGGLQIIDLTTLELTEPFTGLMAQHAWVGIDARAAGNLLYASTELPQSDGSVEHWLLEMNMDTGAVRKLTRSENIFMWYAERNMLYYVEDQKCFVEYDLTTDEKRTIPLPVDELRLATVSGDLIIATGERSEDRTEMNLFFLDRAYHLLDEIHLTDKIVPCFYGKDRILFIDSRGGENYTPTAYLDRAAIGSGNLKLTPIGS